MLPSHSVASACMAQDLMLSVDPRRGEFNGMSHAGTYVIIRNIGRRTCGMQRFPAITLHGSTGQPLARGRAAAGTASEPRIEPIILVPGARVATGLRWVSGPVYGSNRRLVVRSVSVDVAGRAVSIPLRAIVYAQAGTPATFDQSPLAPFR